MNINWYPPMALAGQWNWASSRIGPHTRLLGSATILDREPGRPGLQVWTAPGRLGGRRRRAPGAFTINTGDLLARWSGGRWKSNRHRVLPPEAQAPDEDLISLVYFYEADHDAVIESLQPPIGKPNELRPGRVGAVPEGAPGRDHDWLAGRRHAVRPTTGGSTTRRASAGEPSFQATHARPRGCQLSPAWTPAMAAVVAPTVRLTPASGSAGSALHYPFPHGASPVIAAPPSVALAPVASPGSPPARVIIPAPRNRGPGGTIVTAYILRPPLPGSC